jgi:hypothetical protein
MEQENKILAGVRAAITGFFILLALNLLNLFLFRAPIIFLYPIQVLVYYLVGRIAGNTGREEHMTNGMALGFETDLNYGALGGTAGFVLCIAMWLLYGFASLGLQMVLGGFFVGVFGWMICLAFDLPFAIGVGSLGGKSAQND